jgi:hypothetical protein
MHWLPQIALERGNDKPLMRWCGKDRSTPVIYRGPRTDPNEPQRQLNDQPESIDLHDDNREDVDYLH